MLQYNLYLMVLALWIMDIFYCTGRPIDRGSSQKRHASQQPLHHLSKENATEYLVKYGYCKDKSYQRQNCTATTNSSSSHNNTVSNATIVEHRPTCSERTLADLYSDGEFSHCLKELQKFMSLTATGVLDDPTESVMTTPRCGVKDMSPDTEDSSKYHRRKRRYVTEGSRWPSSKTELKYHISYHSSNFTHAAQKDIMRKAFLRWAEVIPLVFRWTDNVQAADINIQFRTGSHGDNRPFDGPGNELAHAFYPSSGGDVHFDEAESWANSTITVIGDQKSLLKVAIHEIGHSLGLKHSPVTNSIMHSTYGGSTADELTQDDIDGIQSIYGKCETSLQSASSWAKNGRSYVFKGVHYWMLSDATKKAEKDYPKNINEGWGGVPDNIDDSLLWSNNRLYFFKGNQYYRYDDVADKVEADYPKLINRNWSGIPDNIDAAFTYNSLVSYFFKGNQCYKYDNNNDQTFAGYPKKISEEFAGLPDASIDTVFKMWYDARIYFFKGLQYYQYDNNQATGPFSIRDNWKNLCLT